MFEELIVNIPDVIDENTKLAIDCDSLLFKVASGAERTQIEAFHTETDASFGVFKNRTEFWGRSKNKVGSACILADINIDRHMRGLREYTLNEFHIVDIQTPIIGIDFAMRNVESWLDDVARISTIPRERFVYLAGDSGSFRDVLPLPNKYKGGRDHMIKPCMLKEIRRNFIEKYDPMMVDNLEADDVFQWYMMKGYRDWKKTGKASFICSTIDKDSHQSEGFLINYNKANGQFIDENLYKMPEFRKDLGRLTLKKGKLKGVGFKWLISQATMIGDAGDGYLGYQYFDHLKRKWGEKKTFEAIEPMQTHQEVLEFVKLKWWEWSKGTGKFTYIDWAGNKHVDMPWHEFCNMVFLCAWMKRGPNDKATLYDIFEAFGVDIYEVPDVYKSEEVVDESK